MVKKVIYTVISMANKIIIINKPKIFPGSFIIILYYLQNAKSIMHAAFVSKRAYSFRKRTREAPTARS